MQTFEFFSRLIQLDLSGLRFSDLLFKLLTLVTHLNGQLFDLKSELFDFGFVSTPILLKSEVVFLLLSGCESPLFELLLVPIHLQLKLIHAFIGFEDHVLDVVKTVLLVCNALFELLNLVF